MVDRHRNIDAYGKRSCIILTLPITTDKSLKGSVKHYTGIESRVPINKGAYNQATFNVRGYSIVIVPLDCYIM